MKHSFEKLIREAARRESLTTDERRKMQYVIREYAAFKPRRVPSTPKPFWVVSWERARARLARPIAAVGVAAAVLFVGAGGVAYAAEGTLPGDTLYPVKVDVSEPVQTFFTPAKNQAAWQMTLAGRRLEEGAALAARDALSTSTALSLSTKYETHAAAANAAIAREQSVDPLIANITATGFAARLDAYDVVLASAADDRVTSQVAPLRVAVRTDIRRFSSLAATSSPEARSALGQDSAKPPAAERTDRTVEAVLKLQGAADAALRVSADSIVMASSSLTASTSVELRAAYQGAADEADRGRALFAAHDDQGAADAFTNALSAASQLDVLTHAASRLKINIFTQAQASTTDASTTNAARIETSSRHPAATSTPPSHEAPWRSAPSDAPESTASAATTTAAGATTTISVPDSSASATPSQQPHAAGEGGGSADASASGSVSGSGGVSVPVVPPPVRAPVPSSPIPLFPQR